jgi:hypothetical protein
MLYRKPWVEVVKPHSFPEFIDMADPQDFKVGDRFLLVGVRACYSYQDFDELLTELADSDGKLGDPYMSAAVREDEADLNTDSEQVYWVFTVLRADGKLLEADAQLFKFVEM